MIYDSRRASGPPGPRSSAGVRVGATVFGLDVRSQIPLAILARSSAPPTGRPLAIAARGRGAAKLDWPAASQLLCDERRPDGSVIFRIEADPEAGYLISGPDYGDHLLSPDGRRLQCAPPARQGDGWQRLLIAQVLPFAALLQGLEIFHASGVVRDGEAIALLGPSRAGKTSLALELCGRGAGFLADDVLALEAQAEGLLAHPGTSLAGVAPDGAAPVGATDCDTRGEIAVNAGERLLRMPGAAAAAPLAALFFLDRRADGPRRPRFESFADPPMLLAATVNIVLASP
ncbi:MAG: hypothetical protein ACYDHT_11395, partial [Solirubrobacteraceae bacterium]